jgi:hypothetical protein
VSGDGGCLPVQPRVLVNPLTELTRSSCIRLLNKPQSSATSMSQHTFLLLCLAAWSALAAPALRAEPWIDFEVSWHPVSDAAVPVLDLSFLNPKPAGADGFVRVDRGRFIRPDGSRLRLWGVNLTAGACFPPREDAVFLAQRLAQLGVNCVRFHFLDSNWGAQRSLFEWGTDSTRRLDAGQLERLDFFVAELKRRGIYSNFNLNVGRHFRAGDGVVDWRHLGLAKGVTLFDPHLIQLQQEFARQLLTHVNPYTQLPYTQEPALALVELVNENSLVEAWFSGRLVGSDPAPPGDSTWAGITRHYAIQLDQIFHDWLRDQLGPDELRRVEQAAKVPRGTPIPRLHPDEFSRADSFRFATEARFYMALERRFFTGMKGFLRDELGLQALLVATSDHNHYRTGYPLLASAGRLDVVDGHVYWQHPHSTRDPETGRRGFSIPNTPMVNDPLRSTPVQLSRTPLLNQPFTVSETNHPFPNEYAAEGIPILTAYALLHDWDGIFFHELMTDPPSLWAQRRPGHFDFGSDPVKVASFALCGLWFQRGDVSSARQTVLRSYSAEQVIESLRLPWHERPFFTPGFPAGLSLVHATRIKTLDGTPTSYDPLPLPGIISSDTDELRWLRDSDEGRVTIATPRTEAIVGFLAAYSQENHPQSPDSIRSSPGPTPHLRHLAPSVANRFGAILLTSLDNAPIAEAERLILVATARSQLAGMTWNGDRTTLLDWGRRPMQVEPVRAKLRLYHFRDAKELSLQALDPAGHALDPPSPGHYAGGAWEVTLDRPTVWYRIEVRR